MMGHSHDHHHHFHDHGNHPHHPQEHTEDKNEDPSERCARIRRRRTGRIIFLAVATLGLALLTRLRRRGGGGGGHGGMMMGRSRPSWNGVGSVMMTIPITVRDVVSSGVAYLSLSVSDKIRAEIQTALHKFDRFRDTMVRHLSPILLEM